MPLHGAFAEEFVAVKKVFVVADGLRGLRGLTWLRQHCQDWSVTKSSSYII